MCAGRWACARGAGSLLPTAAIFCLFGVLPLFPFPLLEGGEQRTEEGRQKGVREVGGRKEAPSSLLPFGRPFSVPLLPPSLGRQISWLRDLRKMNAGVRAHGCIMTLWHNAPQNPKPKLCTLVFRCWVLNLPNSRPSIEIPK